QIGYAGQSIPRKEDGRLVQGEGVFVDDVKWHGMGYVHFVRSPYAHAQIVSVDVSQAEAMDGVYGTLTPAEVEELTDPFFELTTPPGNQIKDYALAVGRVRHIGEPVVAVVARTRALARAAADRAAVEYEPPHRHRQAPLRHAGHRRRLRQQDHDAHLPDGALPARAQAEAAGALAGVAHRPAHRERARQRALVLGDRGRRPVGRDDARLQGEG